MIQILFGIWLHFLKQSCREFYGEQFFFLLQPLKSFVKASRVSFKLFGEKKFKKNKRGQALLGRPASLLAQPDSVARFPSPLSPARGARLAPPGAGHVAAVRRRWTRRGRPAFNWSGRRPAPPGHSTLSPAPPSLLPPSASVAAALVAPPPRHRRRNSAAHRRPRQCPNLDAKTTSAHVVAAVSPCERSTEVRARRTP